MNKSTISFICFLLITINILAQSSLTERTDQPAADRTLKYNAGNVLISYTLSGFSSLLIEDSGIPGINGFGYINEPGKPMLPMRTELVALPLSGIYSFKCTVVDSIVLKGVSIPFSSGPQIINKELNHYVEIEHDARYQSFYPDEIGEIQKVIQFCGHSIAQLRFTPFRYNAPGKELIIYTHVQFQFAFHKEAQYIDQANASERFKRLYPKLVLNRETILEQLTAVTETGSDSTINYIILTTGEFEGAAQRLAGLKEQLGQAVRIIINDNWSAELIKTTVYGIYHSCSPSPQYLLILGDHEFLPGEFHSYMMVGDFATDLYYACMDGPDDYFPDMGMGRISVKTPEQAHHVIDKIEYYEFFPDMDSSFYSTAMFAAYFQDGNYDTYADRRFAQTAEELYQYLLSTQNMDPGRVYYTQFSRDPQYWENSIFSAGEPIPDELKKPAFPWDGWTWDIEDRLNEGCVTGMYIGHGNVGGWANPSFSQNDIRNLQNPGNYPLIFSMACETGVYWDHECFCETFLLEEDKGSIGAVGASSGSFIGHNEALAMGLIDAIWSDPGFIPDFTGSLGIQNPVCSQHGNLSRLGDILIQGMTRMLELWGDPWGHEEYMFQIMHLFGDPALQLRTRVPYQIVAGHDTLIPNGSGYFTISNCNTDSSLATLVSNGKMIGKAITQNGGGIIPYEEFAGDRAILTISKENHRPWIDTISATPTGKGDPVETGTMELQFIIRPNPARNKLIVETGMPGIISLTDIHGKKLLKTSILAKMIINAAEMKNGMYLIHLDTGTKQATRKIIIHH